MARRRRNPEVIAGRVNADGSIASGDGFTVTKGATGLYTLNFPSSFRLVALTPAPFNNGFGTGQNAVPGQVFIFLSSTAAAADSAFSFIAVGVQQ